MPWAGALLLAAAAARAEAPVAATVLRWTASANARAYELEISTDAAFVAVVLRERVDVNGYRWRELPAVTHYWRVRGVDGKGRVGDWSKAERIEAVFVPPPLEAPAADSIVSTGEQAPEIALVWKPSAVLESYRVEVGRDPEMRELALDERVVESRKSFVPKESGAYFWRVRTVDNRGRESAAGETRGFTVALGRPKLGKPADGARLAAGSACEFRWSPVALAESYLFEVSADASFERALARQTVRGTRVRWAPPAAGKLHWRVLPIDGSGQGAASAARVVAVTLAAPQPLDPGARAPAGTIRFRWLPTAGARRYRVEIGAEAEFATPFAGCSAEGDACEVVLAAGAYLWRVRSEEGRGELSALSEERPLTVDAGVEAPGEAPGSPAAAPLGLYVAPRLGFFYNFGAVAAPRIGAGVGARLPLAGQLADVVLRAGYFTASAGAADRTSDLSASARVHVVPIELLAHYVASTPVVTLYGGAGVALELLYASVEEPTRRYSVGGLELGLVLAGGGEWALGPGWLQVGGQMTLASRRRGDIEIDPGGLALEIGYRLDLR